MNDRSLPHRARELRLPRLSVLGTAVAMLCVAAPAVAAPTPHECAAASEDASSLQKQEKLVEAKDRFLACADAACPAEIREECAHRLTEVTDATPSVVFDVKDAAGNDLSMVRVTMDGALLVDHLGASSVTIDPGEHTFHFDTSDPSQAVEKKFVVRDGEKNRHLAISLAGTPPPGAVPAGATSTGPEVTSSSMSDQKMVALVVGGVGIVGLGLGAVFGALTFSQYSNSKTDPAGQAQTDWNAANTSATVSDIGFIAGGVLVAGAAVLWFTAPSGNKVQVTPAASAQGAGLTLRGTF